MARTRSVSGERELHGPAVSAVSARRDKNMVSGIELDPVLSRLQVANILGVSLPTLWRMVNRRALPRPIRISPGRVGWRASTVRDWLADRSHDGED